jgi:hypothetical protein
MDTDPVPKRPCTLPAVQIDTWGTSAKSSSQSYSVEQLARAILHENEDVACLSLLRVTMATTIVKIVHCIRAVHAPLAPSIRNGQVYLQPNWRIRWDDMNPATQRMVLHVDTHTEAELLRAFSAYYSADKMEACIYKLIGPAREAGARSLRGWRPPPR